MNVALLPSAFHPHVGGVEELSRRLAIELRRQGHVVIVITNRWPRQLVARDDVQGIPLYRLPMRFPGGSVKSKISYVATRGAVRRRLAAILREHATDVMHVQCVSTQAHYTNWAVRRLKIPLVVTLQGELTMDATQLYQRSGRARRLMRDTLDSADAITACSRQTLNEAEAFMGKRWRVPARVIWNGVNVEEIARADPHQHPKPYVFAIGRHVSQKGFDVLLRAFAMRVREGATFDLILAGDGPEHAALRSLAVELGVAGRVRFAGHTDRPMTASLFRGCEFFVLPSRHEPFGIVNLEAMAAGKAIVATSVGGVAEIVEEGVNGSLVPADNARALAAAIGVMASDEAMRRRLAAAGAARVRPFGWESITGDYVQAYSEAITRRRPPTFARRAASAADAS